MRYRRTLILFYIVTIAFIILILVILRPRPGPSEGAQVLARINNYQLTKEDFIYEIKGIRLPAMPKAEASLWKQEVLKNIIRKQIMLQEAQRLGLDKKKNFINMIQRYWEQALLKSLIDAKAREITAEVRVYDNEIEDFYKRLSKRIRARVLFLTDRDSAEGLRSAGDNLEDAVKGLGPRVVDDLGETWYSYDERASEIEGLIFSLKDDERLVVSPLGDRWVFVRVSEVTPLAVRPLAELRDDISHRIRRRKQTHKMEAWLEGLRSKANVAIDKKILEEIDISGIESR